MSLFGDDTSNSHHESPPPESTSHIIPPSSFEVDGISLQNAQTPYSSLNVYDESDDGNESEDEVSGENEDGLDAEDKERRPNRFTGHGTTWKRYTAPERRIAAALDQAEAGDLAVHLYNAHALKRRARRPPKELADVRDWQGRDSWLRKGDDLQFTDDAGDMQTELIPPRRWTAWPLPPHNVPASDERFRLPDTTVDDGWVIGGMGEQEPGDELREEMLALFLRLAKEKWRARPTNDGSELDRYVRQSRSKFKTNPSVQDAGSSIDMRDAESVKNEDRASQSRQPSTTNHAPDKRSLRYTQQHPTKPTFLTDDDKARRLLQPSINSMLAHLDDVGEALRCTRQNHYGRWGAHGYTSDSGMTTDTEPGTPGLESHNWFKSGPARRATQEGKGRSRSKSQSVSKRQKIQPPQSQQLPVDSDSASDYGAEQEQAKKARSRPRENVARGTSSVASSAASRSQSKSPRPQDELRSLPLDWSEVLGAAASRGWNEQAIARTAQRCAALFGESMAFRSFDESLATKPIPDPVQYTPTTIPNPRVLGTSSTTAATKRPFFAVGTRQCPHTDCWAHGENYFPIAYRVIEHCKRVHGYDPRKNNSENEERTFGGVHIDGFLEPINTQQGWLGQGRSKHGKVKKEDMVVERLRKKKTGESEGDGDGVVDVESEST